MKKHNALLLDNQLCFSLYRLSKMITSSYRPLLDEINLTYPQYLVMLVMWEDKKINMTDLGERLSLDNGTLTPLIKRLIDKGILEKKRSDEDERIVFITLTSDGQALKKKASKIPQKASCAHSIDIEKLIALKKLADEVFEDMN